MILSIKQRKSILNNNNLADFINVALSSQSSDKFFTIEILQSTSQRIKEDTKLNIFNYSFVIQEQYIRHIRNRHIEDMKYLVEIPNILNNFDKVEKSIIRNNQTGKNEVSLVFRKKLNNNKIQMVALRILNNKILSLKTLFSLDIKK